MASKPFEFTIDGEGRQVFFDDPTHQESLIIDMEVRKVWSEAVRAGIMTMAELTKQAKKTEAWTQSDDEKINKTMFEIALLESIIRNKKSEHDEKTVRDAVEKTAKLRAEVMKASAEKSRLYDNSAEAVAEEQRIHHYAILCLKDSKTKRRVFESVSDYEEIGQKHKKAVSEVYRRAFHYLNDLPEDISSEWAEVQWLLKQSEEARKNLEVTADEVEAANSVEESETESSE